LHSGVLNQGRHGLASEAVYVNAGRQGMAAILKSDNMVARLDVGHTLADGLDDTGTLVTQDDWEGTLRILSGECVGVCVADTGVVDLDSELVGLGGCNLDILDAELLAGLPGDGRLTGDGLKPSYQRAFCMEAEDENLFGGVVTSFPGHWSLPCLRLKPL
jgi:hypothetical protein